MHTTPGDNITKYWEETSLLDQAKNNTSLLIKEALHIRFTNLGLNSRDECVAFRNARFTRFTQLYVVTSQFVMFIP